MEREKSEQTDRHPPQNQKKRKKCSAAIHPTTTQHNMPVAPFHYGGVTCCLDKKEIIQKKKKWNEKTFMNNRSLALAARLAHSQCLDRRNRDTAPANSQPDACSLADVTRPDRRDGFLSLVWQRSLFFHFFSNKFLFPNNQIGCLLCSALPTFSFLYGFILVVQ